MDREKAKEIKKALEQNIKSGLGYEDNDKFCNIMLADILTLINELESENERIKQSAKNLAFVNEKVIEENQKLKDRIAELEEALLDMVVQFCQMGKEGYLHHTFMSAEENAFDVLDIEYGEKVDDVYKRFNEKWEEKMENKLKPCPFCGNEDIIIEKLYYKEDIFLNAYHFSVDCVCQKCRTLKNITVIGKNQEECCNKVKEEWNKRI